MIAPLDSKALFEAGGETFTIRLNFQTIALADEHGIDLLFGGFPKLSSVKMAVLIRCLAVCDHPDMTNDQALAIVAQADERLGKALAVLYLGAAGVPDDVAGEVVGNLIGREASQTASPSTGSSSGGSKPASRQRNSGGKHPGPIN